MFLELSFECVLACHLVADWFVPMPCVLADPCSIAYREVTAKITSFSKCKHKVKLNRVCVHKKLLMFSSWFKKRSALPHECEPEARLWYRPPATERSRPCIRTPHFNLLILNNCVLVAGARPVRGRRIRHADDAVQGRSAEGVAWCLDTHEELYSGSRVRVIRNLHVVFHHEPVVRGTKGQSGHLTGPLHRCVWFMHLCIPWHSKPMTLLLEMHDIIGLICADNGFKCKYRPDMKNYGRYVLTDINSHATIRSIKLDQCYGSLCLICESSTEGVRCVWESNQ